MSRRSGEVVFCAKMTKALPRAKSTLPFFGE
jgi:hypothetical protein